MGARGLVIRDDVGAAELRRFAQGEADRRAALRAVAIAQALEGASRAEAARVVGRERQSLRDAVVCFNAEGLAGLWDRPRPGRPKKLSMTR
jgi:transposase